METILGESSERGVWLSSPIERLYHRQFESTVDSRQRSDGLLRTLTATEKRISPNGNIL